MTSGAALERLKDAGLALEEAEDRLVLRDLRDARVTPLSVDFLSPNLRHRLKTGLSKSQPFAKALGLKGAGRPRILDATAGLGVDAFIMAAYGCEVLSIERNETVYALLQDGLRRLRMSSEPRMSEIGSRLEFVQADAIQYLGELSPEARPQVIYVDPMYPEEGRSKSALPKKGMQIFRRLIGEDLDVEQLIAAARSQALERVVVKRPLQAASLKGVAHVFAGKTARFDIFLNSIKKV